MTASFWGPKSIRGQLTPNSKQQKPGGTSARSSVTCLIACPQKIGRCGPNRAKACEPPNIWVFSSSQPPKKHRKKRRTFFLSKIPATRWVADLIWLKSGSETPVQNPAMSPFGSWGQVDNPSPTPKHRLEIPLKGRKHQSPFVGRRRLQTNKELGQQFCPFHSLSHLPINAWKKKTSSNSLYPSCNPKKLPKSLVILFS